MIKYNYKPNDLIICELFYEESHREVTRDECIYNKPYNVSYAVVIELTIFSNYVLITNYLQQSHQSGQLL